MDLVRSCYLTTMSFDKAGLLKANVRWFFTAPNAKVFPGPHLFGSNNWQAYGSPPVGPGEDWNAVRPWLNGKRPQLLTGKGQFCGPLAWFQQGCPSDAPRLQVGPDSVPICCGQGGLGGIFEGATTPALCQTYYHDPLALVRWGVYDWMPFSFGGHSDGTWENPLNTDQRINFHAEPGFNCNNLGFGTTGVISGSADFHHDGPLRLVAYDSVNRIGTWVPPTALSWLGSDFVQLKFQAPYPGRGGIRVAGKTPFGFRTYVAYAGIEPGGTSYEFPIEKPYGGIKQGGTSVEKKVAGATGGLRPGGYSSNTTKLLYESTGGLLPGAAGSLRVLVPAGSPGGIKTGATSAYVSMVEGTGGLLGGGTSSAIERAQKGGGELLGGVSSQSNRALSAGGLRTGATGAVTKRVSGHGGLLPGATSADRKRQPATGGLKIGGTSRIRKRVPAAGGVKTGGTTAPYNGVLTTCCAVAIPTTLYVRDTDNLVTYTVTYNAGTGQWPFFSAFYGNMFVSCTTFATIKGLYVQHAPQAHCSGSPTGVTASCVFPLLMTETLAWGGASCPNTFTSHWTVRTSP